jgi:hypothetical protein
MRVSGVVWRRAHVAVGQRVRDPLHRKRRSRDANQVELRRQAREPRVGDRSRSSKPRILPVLEHLDSTAVAAAAAAAERSLERGEGCVAHRIGVVRPHQHLTEAHARTHTRAGPNYG